MKRDKILIAIISFSLLIIGTIGIISESQLENKFNGGFVHILVIPIVSMLAGLLFVLFMKNSKSMNSKVILSCCIATLTYFIAAVLAMDHYGFSWQIEWFLFCAIVNVVVYTVIWFSEKLKG